MCLITHIILLCLINKIQNKKPEMDESGMEISLFMNVILSYNNFQKKKISCKKVERTFVKFYNSPFYRNILSNDDKFIKQHIRVSAKSLHSMILLFEENNHGYCLKYRLCVFLYWLACGASYRVTGVSFEISRYSVRTIVHKMLDLFINVSKKIIKLPRPEEYETIGHQFNLRSKCGIFSKAVGAIDGCHVKIMVPVHLHDQYINRKLDYSLNVMAVCDSYGKFTSILSGYPGSVHDQRVLRNSALYRSGTFPPPGYYLLGDSGYKCALHPVSIITPFRHDRALTTQEKKFNTLHSRARSIIENAFGRMKTRWRSIFQKSLELKIQNCVKTIVACCVMHNICLNDGVADEMNDAIEYEPDDNSSLSSNLNSGDDETALEFRNTLVGLI